MCASRKRRPQSSPAGPRTTSITGALWRSDTNVPVIAAQDARCVKVYRRTERGEWRDGPDVYRDSDRFELPRLTRTIAVDGVYDDILDGGGRSLLR